MWNDKKSLILSKACVLIFMTMLIICTVFAPRIVAWLMWLSIQAQQAGRGLLLLTIYTGSAAGAALLVFLYILLHRIGAGSVFIKENTACLRYISWCCFSGAVIGMASALYYVPWSAVGIAAAFMGLIVRVIKNVFAKAVSLQDDAELTI